MKARNISIFGPVYWFWRVSVEIRFVGCTCTRKQLFFHLVNVPNIRTLK